MSVAIMGLGLLVGMAIPVHAAGVSCGTGFFKSNDAEVADLRAGLRGLGDVVNGGAYRSEYAGGAVEACAQARDTPKVIAWVVMGLGLVVGVGWLSARANVRSDEAG